jgi:hypothetical protein
MISLAEQPPASHGELCSLEFIVPEECPIITLTLVFFWLFLFNYYDLFDIFGLHYSLILVHRTPIAIERVSINNFTK